MGKVTNSKSLKLFIGIILILVLAGFFIAYFYYVNFIYWSLATWPWALAEILGYIKKPLQESEMLRWIATGILTVLSYFLYKFKKEGGKTIGAIELVGGIVTIYCCFKSNFESDLIYALAVSGGIFLLVDGFELVSEEKKKNIS